MTDKRYSSVLDMMKDIDSDDTDFNQELADQLESRTMIRALLAHRAARGLSQRDMVERTQMSQSVLSRMENKPDDEIKYGDFRNYAEAVGVEWPSLLPRDMNKADRMKAHFILANRELRDLTVIANDSSDDDIAEGVGSLALELIYNAGRAIEWVSKILRRQDGSPVLEVQQQVMRTEAQDASQPQELANV